MARAKATMALTRSVIGKLKVQEVKPFSGQRPHVDSGSIVANMLIGGSLGDDGKPVCPGYPRRAIVEIYGPESSGKCLVAGTYLSTGRGLLTVAEAFQVLGYVPTCTTKVQDGVSLPLINRHGQVETATTLTWNGKRPVFRVRLSDGGQITATENHPHLTLRDGHFVWTRVADLRVGDHLVAPTNVPCFGTRSLPVDEAYFLGVLIADGSLGETRIAVTNDDPEVLRVVRETGAGVLGVAALEYPAGNSLDLHFNAKESVHKFYQAWELRPCVAKDKVFTLPMRMLDQESMGHLLAGYLDCEASFQEGSVFEVSSASQELLQQLRLMLRAFGVVAGIKPKVVKDYPDTPYWRLSVSGGDLVTLRTALPLRRDFGLDAAGSARVTRPIPGVQKIVRSLYDSHGETTRSHNKLATDLLSGKTANAQAVLDMLDRADWSGGDPLLVEQLRRLTAYEYVAVEEIEPLPAAPTFDVVVPGTHSFVAEGVVTHNTTLALEAVKQVQRQGGCVMYLDFEHALDFRYARSIGVSFHQDQMLLLEPDTLEQGLNLAFVGIRTGFDLIVVDSVAAMIPAADLEKSVEENAKVGAQAAALSRNLPKLVLWLGKHPQVQGARDPKHPGTCLMLINQERSVIDTGGGGKGRGAGGGSNSPGGKALRFYMSLRLRVTRKSSMVHETYDPLRNSKQKRPWANVVDVCVVKNKVDGRQGQRADIILRYGYGVDNALSTIQVAQSHNIVRTAGAVLTYDGQKFQGREKLRRYLLQNPQIYKILQQQVSDAVNCSREVDQDEEVREEDIIIAELMDPNGDNSLNVSSVSEEAVSDADYTDESPDGRVLSTDDSRPDILNGLDDIGEVVDASTETEDLSGEDDGTPDDEDYSA